MSLTIHGTGKIEGMTSVNVAGAVNASTIVTLASSENVPIGAANSNTVYVTGSSVINGYDDAPVGVERTVIYTGISSLIHNPISHIVRGGANKTTAIGDSADWLSLGGGNWFMLDYNAAAGAGSEVTLAGAETLTNKRISAFYVLDKTAVNPAAADALTFNLSTASFFNLILSNNVTGVTISNPPVLSGETLTFIVRVSQGATAYALTWFLGITWLTPGGVAPAAPAAGKTMEYVFTSTAFGLYEGRKGAST